MDLLTAEHSCLVGALHRNRTLGETVLQILQLSRISTTEVQGCFIIRREKHQHFDHSAIIIIPCLRVAMPPVKAVLNIASPTWRRRSLRLLLSLTWNSGLSKPKSLPGDLPQKYIPYFVSVLEIIVQELCESRGGRPGLSVLTSLLVSVDVKQQWTMLRHWSQLVPNMSTDIRGH